MLSTLIASHTAYCALQIVQLTLCYIIHPLSLGVWLLFINERNARTDPQGGVVWVKWWMVTTLLRHWCGRSYSNRRIKPGFHYPSSRPELTARELGCIIWHPSTRVINSDVKKCTRVHRPSTRSVNSGSGNRALLFYPVNAVSCTCFWQRFKSLKCILGWTTVLSRTWRQPQDQLHGQWKTSLMTPMFLPTEQTLVGCLWT